MTVVDGLLVVGRLRDGSASIPTPSRTWPGQYAERGGDVAATIQRRKRLTPPVEPKITGEIEARLIALACSTPPAGHARWSLRLLERHVALVEDIPAMDHSTIGRGVKKRRFVLI